MVIEGTLIQAMYVFNDAELETFPARSWTSF